MEIDVPRSTRNKIQSQFHTDWERKDALLSVYVTEHPEPTWEHVSDALYRCNGGDEECHRTLDRVQSKYPTGECRFPSLLHANTVKPPKKGHFGNSTFVLSSEVFLFSEVLMMGWNISNVVKFVHELVCKIVK